MRYLHRGSLLAGREGWSVIELLVAAVLIAVLALLAGTGLGVLRKHQASARCSHNLRQISVALNLYAQDRGVFPHYIDGNTRWFDGSANPSSFFAGPYLGSVPWSKRFAGAKSPSAKGGLFDCPGVDTRDKEGLGPDEWIEDFFDYGLNISLCGRTPASIPSPGRTVAITEGGNYARVKAQHVKGVTYTPNESSNPGGTAWNWAKTNDGTSPIIYTKNKRACFLFLDGHVSLHEASDLAESWFDCK